jgi:hypothetical protein
MAGAVVSRILADGWVIAPPIAKWGDPAGMTPPSDMTPADAEDDLRQCVCFALKLFRQKPPRSRKPGEWESYHCRLAETVVRAILASNWKLAGRTLQKLPPGDWPSAFPPKTPDGD